MENDPLLSSVQVALSALRESPDYNKDSDTTAVDIVYCIVALERIRDEIIKGINENEQPATD